MNKNDREVAWYVNGDFNIIRSAEERRNKVSSVCYEDFTHFNLFIEDNYLIILPLCGRRITWYHRDGLSMSRLDRFMLSEDWSSLWANCIQTAIARC